MKTIRAGWVGLGLAAGLVLGTNHLGVAEPAKGKQVKESKKLEEKVKEIAGTAEFLRSVPKHFAVLQAVDPGRHQVTLLLEGEVLPKVWPLVGDAEIKVAGWWGRLGDFTIGDRVWVWFKTDRKKQPVAISMIADEPSEQDIHGRGVTVEILDSETITVKPAMGKPRKLKVTKGTLAEGKGGPGYYLQTAGGKVRRLMTGADFENRCRAQKLALRKIWTEKGLPGTVSFVHIFSGEMELMLDHEAMRWGRSLQIGDKVSLAANPPIKALVKFVKPWRERTQVRLVVHSQDLADLNLGERLHLLRTPPPSGVDSDVLPPDLDRPRSRAERIEWFLASIYCTCGVKGDRCTGHFYTLASCNPNGCGMPNHMRKILAAKVDAGKTDRQIFEELVKETGPDLVRPHLLP